MKKKEIAKYDYFDIVLGRKILGIVKMADKKQKSDTIRETKYVYDTKNRLVSYTDRKEERKRILTTATAT